MVYKIFAKLVNNRLIDHLEKCGRFCNFQYDSRSSRSTADHLTVVSYRILNRSVATQVVALDVFQVFKVVWHASSKF